MGRSKKFKYLYNIILEIIDKHLGITCNEVSCKIEDTINTYENFQEYTDINEAKVYQVIVKKNGDSNNSELFVVSSDGSVLSGS